MEIDAPLRLYLLFFLFWGLVFFTSSETSLFSLGRLGIHKLKKEKHPSHAIVKRLLAKPRRLIISLLIGNESVNVAISALTIALFIGLWGDAAKWAAIPVVVFIMLLFGEVIPKTIGVHHPEKIASFLSSPVERYTQLISPLRWVLEKNVNLSMRLLGIPEETPPESLTEEAFKKLVEASQKEGSLEESEKNLIHRVFKFGDQVVKNIMTPRAAVFALPLNTKLDRAIEALKENRYSRVPVFGKNLDNIVGILNTEDLLGAREREKHAADLNLRFFLRKPYFIPSSKKLDDLFRELQKQRIHLAIVVNEFGGLAGIVTLEDLLEELFGEIYDEIDLERQSQKRKRKIE